MEVGKKIKKFFGLDPEFDIKDMIEFRKEKIDLLKSEISDIISQIDANESTYVSMINSTKENIEKGFKDGDTLVEHIESRYKNRESELLKSLGSKKAELNRHQSKLNDLLEKGCSGQHYADSIIKNSNGDILLLLRRASSDFHPNTWGLPGGKVESGEESSVAALRELKEETNLDGENSSLRKEKMLPDGGKICYYSVYVKEGTENWIALDDEEHGNYTFMSVEEIRKRPKEDFILDLKETLLEIVDPQQVHVSTITKAHENGMIDDIIFERAIGKYQEFPFEKFK